MSRRAKIVCTLGPAKAPADLGLRLRVAMLRLRVAVLRAHRPEADVRLIAGTGHWAAYEAADTVTVPAPDESDDDADADR